MGPRGRGARDRRPASELELHLDAIAHAAHDSPTPSGWRWATEATPALSDKVVKAMGLLGRRILGAGLALLTLHFNPGPLHAQRAAVQNLEVGDSVRVRLPGALRVDASIRGLQRDTLMLGTEGLDGLWPVSTRDLLSLEKYADRSRQEGFRNGAVLGLVAGVFVGAAVGLGLHALDPEDEGDANVQIMSRTLRWSGLGAVFGGVGGGILGSRRPGRGWVVLELPVG